MQVQVRIVLDGKETGRRLLGKGAITIGQEEDCEIRISHPHISRHHARMTVHEQGVDFEDLDSEHGTYVGLNPVKGVVTVNVPADIRVGAAILEIRQVGAAEEAREDKAEPSEAHPDRLMRLETYYPGAHIASGGMGSVLEAQDRNLQRRVAMKVMRRQSSSRENVMRFIQEARVLGRLEHPNIIPIHALGVDQEGRVFYAMKLVRGLTLHKVLNGIEKGDQQLVAKYPLAQLLTVYQKVCDAVSFAHSRRIVHRDLKPANIMLGDFGEVLVMDWGLAKFLDERDPQTAASTAAGENAQDLVGPDTDMGTLDGQVLGSPNFMAPEQAEGRISNIDERTDIFALGGILYNILTLDPPVKGSSVTEMISIVKLGNIEAPVLFNPPAKRLGRKQGLPAQGRKPFWHCPGGRIPEALSAVTMKALARQPEARYGSVQDLQKEITAYQSGHATDAEQATTWKLLRLALKRHKTEFSLIATALVVIAAVVAGFTGKVTRTLAELRSTAPAFYRETRWLVEEREFAEALLRINYALKLEPGQGDYHRLRGNILEALLRLPEAQAAYGEALKAIPDDERAQRSQLLCERLLQRYPSGRELPREALEEIRLVMLAQDRFVEAAWLAEKQLAGGPAWVLYSNVLAKAGWAFEFREGQSNQLLLAIGPATVVSDLAPLKGMPLSDLRIASARLSHLIPLRGMPLRSLVAAGTNTAVRDLAPLRGLALERLELENAGVTSLLPLRGMPLRVLHLKGWQQLADVSPLAGCRQLEELVLPRQVQAPDFLRHMSGLKILSYPPAAEEPLTTVEQFWAAAGTNSTTK